MTNSQVEQKSLIIFVHIPKTAGTTLKSIIRQNYSPSAIFMIPHIKPFKGIIEEIKKRISEPSHNLGIITGHMGFGLYEYLTQKYIHITMLRDPIKRIISAYNWYKGNPDINNPINLENFCQVRGSNEMTKWLSGLEFPHQLSIGYKELKRAKEKGDARLLDYHHQCSSPNLLKVAKNNLKKYFPAIGITERFDESLILFQKTLGWKNIWYTRLNVTKNKLPDSTISPEILDFIKKHNELDMELYKYAQVLFEQQIIQYGSSFDKDLKTFQSLNPTMGKLYSFPERLKKYMGSIGVRNCFNM